MSETTAQQAGTAATVLQERKDGVLRITLNKPDAANAISPDQR